MNLWMLFLRNFKEECKVSYEKRYGNCPHENLLRRWRASRQSLALQVVTKEERKNYETHDCVRHTWFVLVLPADA